MGGRYAPSPPPLRSGPKRPTTDRGEGEGLLALAREEKATRDAVREGLQLDSVEKTITKEAVASGVGHAVAFAARAGA